MTGIEPPSRVKFGLILKTKKDFVDENVLTLLDCTRSGLIVWVVVVSEPSLLAIECMDLDKRNKRFMSTTHRQFARRSHLVEFFLQMFLDQLMNLAWLHVWNDSNAELSNNLARAVIDRWLAVNNMLFE